MRDWPDLKDETGQSIETMRRKKSGINRYKFETLFNFDFRTGHAFPLFNTIVNGEPFRRGATIQRGISFGGLDLYKYIGRDIAGKWNPTSICTKNSPAL